MGDLFCGMEYCIVSHCCCFDVVVGLRIVVVLELFCGGVVVVVL